MLTNVHVKNFALIEEADLSFGEGLNILTGETGAGKSILIDAVNAALGGKISRDMIRTGQEYALVELVFWIRNRELLENLKAMDVEPDEDGNLILSRRIMEGRGVSRIGGSPVPVAKVREVTKLLLDIHGQHEHQSLLYPSKHLEILDEFAKKDAAPVKKEISRVYSRYQECLKELEGFSLPEEERLRQLDFLRFEIDEIENARLSEGEEEELTSRFRRMQHAQKIAESISEASAALGYDSYESAGEQISRAVKELSEAERYDPEAAPLREMCETVESLLNDLNRSLSEYREELTFDEEEYRETESRLDLIHGLQAKYGRTFEEIMKSLDERKEREATLLNYEEKRARAEQEREECRQELETLSEELSMIRRRESFELAESIRNGLIDLNFLDVQFSISFEKTEDFTRNGTDKVEFLISTNPGEEPKPLGRVASGGELSRIMLAIKAVLADSDDIPTLIFDEIDTGISGRTAQKVSEKLAYIAGSHQVLCITHLPQIAAMADCHYRIVKSVQNGKTFTQIQELEGDEILEELARLLGGVSITDTVLGNAAEMKQLADGIKRKRER